MKAASRVWKRLPRVDNGTFLTFRACDIGAQTVRHLLLQVGQDRTREATRVAERSNRLQISRRSRKGENHQGLKPNLSNLKSSFEE